MLKEYGLDSLSHNFYNNAFDITTKIAACKAFTDKEKILSDGLKCYTSYIGLTSEPAGFDLFDNKQIGNQYFDFNNQSLSKNKDPKIAKVF